MRKSACGASLFLLISCGGTPPPAPEAPEHASEAAPPPVRRAPKLAMSSELGEIDSNATERAFESLQPPLMRCYQEGQRRVRYLAGDLKIFLRVAPGGSARWVYLEDSTLGDRQTERCIIDSLAAARWPQTSGGDAEVHKSMGFEPPSNVRPPADWSVDRIAATLGKQGEEANKCKEGARGRFHVSAYIEPHGKLGKVQAVGVAPPTQDSDDRVECIVEAVMKMKMPSPGSWAAKVTFDL